MTTLDEQIVATAIRWANAVENQHADDLLDAENRLRELAKRKRQQIRDQHDTEYQATEPTAPQYAEWWTRNPVTPYTTLTDHAAAVTKFFDGMYPHR